MVVNKIDIKQLTQESFTAAFQQDGYVVVENVFSEDFTKAIIPDLESAIQSESEKYHSKDHKDYGMLLACSIYGGRFLDVIENRNYIEPFNWILGETCIVWVYTSSGMAPSSRNYASRIHVDRSYFTPGGYTDAMGSLILLNDFTLENGATYLLPKSHLKPDEPTEEYFYDNAVRLVAPRGSVFYFNLRLWHAGGKNTTNNWRHALGIGMIKPYLKQRIDLPRAMEGVDIHNLTHYGKQKLGYYAQPPSSVEQYYKNASLALLQQSEWDLDREKEKFQKGKNQ
jgi:ectoine hydroxylase-related dioxygenase (phytanoyl-CoA dioxygenase family)